MSHAMTEASEGESRRIPGLDGVRGLAILLVLWGHYLTTPAKNPESIAERLGSVFTLGWGGVDLFFVLSGYLITGILVDNRDSPGYFATFYGRRACRILPPYLVLLGGCALFAASVGHLAPGAALDLWEVPAWAYLSFLQNGAMAVQNSFGSKILSPTWSLAVEEQFYLALPFLVRFAPKRTVAITLAFGAALAPIFRLVSPNGVAAYVLAPCRADSLLAGALVALLVRWTPARKLLESEPMARKIALFVGVAGVMALSYRPDGVFGSPFGHLWLAGASAALVIEVVCGSRSLTVRAMNAAPLRWFGTRSYSLYLFHVPVLWMAFRVRGLPEPVLRTAADAATLLGALVLALAMAEVSHRLVEAPFIRVGHRLKFGSGETAACVAGSM